MDFDDFTRSQLEALARVQIELVRSLEAELAKRDAMIAQAVGVMLQAKEELTRPAITATSASLDNGKYHAMKAGKAEG